MKIIEASYIFLSEKLKLYKDEMCQTIIDQMLHRNLHTSVISLF